MKPDTNPPPRYPVLAHLYAWGLPIAIYGIGYWIDAARGLL